MVLGHSGAPFTHWIFLFHMAVFYMASGYFWNDKHIATFATFGQYFLKKVKMLYVPYLLCNIGFILLNNFFIDTGIYASSSEYLELIGSEDSSLLHDRMSMAMMIKNIIALCLFIGGTELGGPTWFFSSLFIALVVYSSIRFLLNRFVKSAKTIDCIEIVISIMFLTIAWLISEEKVDFRMFNRLFAAYPLLVIGGWMHRLDEIWKPRWWGLLLISSITMGVLLLLNPYGSISMARCKIVSPFFFLITSLSGWFLLASLSKLKPLKPLVRLGASTRSIVMWHFISMKSVTCAYVLVVGLPVVLIGAFPYLKQAPSYLWIIYTIVGVGIPYFLGIIYDRIKIKIINIKK